jgi:hypothetical protein
VTWREAAVAATWVLFLLSGLAGWALCAAAYMSRRYSPALAHAGTAIGLWPTYLLALVVGRALGASPQSAAWELATRLAVATAVVALTGMAIRLAVLAWRVERRQRRGGD